MKNKKSKSIPFLYLFAFFLLVFFPFPKLNLAQASPKTITEKLNAVRGDFIDKYQQIEAAGAAMSSPIEVIDYYTRTAYQLTDPKIKIEPLFPDWEDINVTIEINGQKIKRKDPVTFYFPKEGNEMIVADIASIRYEDTIPPPPPEGWPAAPPPLPGKLQWPLIGKITDYFGCVRRLKGCGPASKWTCCTGGRGDLSSDWHFAERSDKRVHWGIDIGAPSLTLIKAPAPGIVVAIRIRDPEKVHKRSCGNTLTIYHPELGISTVYYHLHKYFPIYHGIKKGKLVNLNDPIAFVGDTGSEGFDHLHFQVHPCKLRELRGEENCGATGCDAVDPLHYLPPLSK